MLQLHPLKMDETFNFKDNLLLFLVPKSTRRVNEPRCTMMHYDAPLTPRGMDNIELTAVTV